jgi:hypothetical protein
MSVSPQRGAVGFVLDQIVVEDGDALRTDEVFIRFAEALARSRFSSPSCAVVGPRRLDSAVLARPKVFGIVPPPRTATFPTSAVGRSG